MFTLDKPLSKFYIAGVLITAALLGVLSMFMPLEVMAAIMGVLAIGVVIAKPQLGLALLIPALFFEADAYSVTLPFGRVRLYHVLIVALALRVVFDLMTGRRTWRKTVLDWPLFTYVILNWATVALAPDYAIGFKIAGLITLLAVLYWVVTQLITTPKQFLVQAELFLLAALGIALFGLFQVFAVWLASHVDIVLWSGPIIHSDVLPYGRPYATFVEPDWYGTTMAAALVGTICLAFSKSYKDRQLELSIVGLIFLIATVLSSVRGGWLAAAATLLGLLVINRAKLKILDTKLLTQVTVSVVVLVTLALVFAPAIREALTSRVATLFTSDTLDVEPRFLIMQDGWELFLKHPWVGRGPGAYTTLGTIPFVTPLVAAIYDIANFQTNAILTVLIDTGLIGLALVIWMGFRFCQRVWKVVSSAQKTSPEVRAVLFSLFGAGITLALAYQVSSGIWLGLTWYLAALIIAGSSVGVSTTKNHAS